MSDKSKIVANTLTPAKKYLKKDNPKQKEKMHQSLIADFAN
jgi:hypothetical protein